MASYNTIKINVNKFHLKAMESNKTPIKEYWTFIHENNPSIVEIVSIDINGNLKGDDKIINKLRTIIDIPEIYIPDEDFTKHFEDEVQRSQTGEVSSKKGTKGSKSSK